MNKIISGIVGLVLVYGAINLVLVGGQNVLHAGDQARLDEIKKQLEVEKIQINSSENELKTLGQNLDTSQARTSDLESRIQAIEKSYPSGVPSAVYADYKRMLSDHNALIDPYNTSLNQYKSIYADYSSRIDKYNALVAEGNALSKKIGSTWVIIPVPRIGSRK